MEKISEMIVAVAGDLLKTPESLEEMQAHLDLVKHAWNMSLYSGQKRKEKLKKFIDSQRPHAPDIERLKGLEWQYRRIMKQKDDLFPSIRTGIAIAEAIETGNDEYIIRAYSIDEPELR